MNGSMERGTVRERISVVGRMVCLSNSASELPRCTTEPNTERILAWGSGGHGIQHRGLRQLRHVNIRSLTPESLGRATVLLWGGAGCLG
jgi:hypothetical protein